MMGLNEDLQSARLGITNVAVHSGNKNRDFRDDVRDIAAAISKAMGAKNYFEKARYIEDAKQQMERLQVQYDFDANEQLMIHRAINDLDSAYYLVETKRKQMAGRKKAQKVRKVTTAVTATFAPGTVNIETMINRAKKSIGA